MSDTDRPKASDALFMQFIASLGASALQQMGKLVNPATGKTETQLEGARYTIDLLDMLERKTRGNVSDDEKRLFGETLTMLRLNYVETVNAAAPSKPEAAAAGAKPQAEESAPAGAQPAAAADAASTSEAGESGKKDDTPPRFHKSYG